MMRLMTYGYSEDDIKGLLEITEVDEYHQQEIVFAIPLDEELASDMKSKRDFFELLKGSKIKAKIAIGDNVKNISLSPNKLKQVLIARVNEEVVQFDIDHNLNFKRSLRFYKKPILKDKELITLLRALTITIGVFFHNLLIMVIAEGMMQAIGMRSPDQGIKNIYVGKEYSREYKNLRFLILSVNDIRVLDKLFIERKICFINE